MVVIDNIHGLAPKMEQGGVKMRPPFRVQCIFTVFLLCVSCLAGDQPSTAANNWNVVASLFRPVNITAQGARIWVCGADEMILSSTDGGATWETKHLNPDGEVLVDISFVNEKVGHAGGTGGLLLSTDDGGQTWKSHIAPGAVRAFSFADALNGIAVISEGHNSSRVSSSDQAVPIEGTVKITHDGGEHWDDIPAINSEELRPFVQTLSIAALDSSHFLMLRRQPEVEDVFLVTKDGGRSWKVVHPQNDATNRVLPRMVFGHQGEYWAFGHELVHREKGGGYGVPLTLHSKDGETWTHGVAGPKEFDSCSSQGCYMWDGAVEALYGEREQFWALPQDGSLGKKWAIAEGKGCTVSDSTLKCGRATVTDKPADRPEPPGGMIYLNVRNEHLADGCLECHVEGIVPDNAGPPSMQQVHASVTIRRDGTVASVSVDYPRSKRMSDDISNQLSKWLFEPGHKGPNTVETKKDISLLLACSGFPGRPETNRCTLYRSDEFSGAHAPTRIVTTTVKQ
jgi:photosystem II stability/assembly factor-like uncharacterized protein